jgi:hypothetical protein
MENNFDIHKWQARFLREGKELSQEQKKVERFVKSIAKEFDYSEKDAARFIKDTITKLDLK